MQRLDTFEEHVGLKYQIYNGLFLDLPYHQVRQSGIMLPLFTSYCRERLEEGDAPERILEEFFRERMGDPDFEELRDIIFKFMQIVERQVVLFDAIEDAAFGRIHDIEGTGSLKDVLGRIEAEDKTEEYRQFLQEYRVRMVLTAHPTQFYPDEVLAIITDLGEAILSDNLQEIYDLLLQMGKTRFKNKEKPTPLDEAKSLLWFLENVFYDILPEVQDRMWRATGDDFAEIAGSRPNLELGFWPGGDRDGNPFVTSDLTVEIGNLLRSSILRRYQSDLSALSRRLTFPGIVEPMETIAEKLRFTLYPLIRIQGVDGYEEQACEDASDQAYQSAEQFVADLAEVRDSLKRDHLGLFAERVESLLAKVRVFGFHFATMDIRQDSRVHRDVVAELMRHIGPRTEKHFPFDRYAEAPLAERIAMLHAVAKILPIREDVTPMLEDGTARDTILSIRAAKLLQDTNGERAVHRYVISNTRDAANVLEVWLLAQCAAMEDRVIALDIVPLFETIDDLVGAPDIMDMLYRDSLYSDHLQRRGGFQTIMVGFSDGTKDGGYVTANWQIFRAKERLTEISRGHGVRVAFFDGRGGPPGRGGGNTHKFYRSLARTIANEEIHLTVQGQTISSKYGNPDAARFNVEQLVSAGMENNLFPQRTATLREQDVALLDKLSDEALRSYRKLREHPAFLDYLQEMTPLSYYGKTNIASRPTSRSGAQRLSLEDLRAIPFVGAWSQMKQNVPGFYGFGTALATLLAEGEEEALQELYRRSLFFRTLVENAMQSLSKTYYPLTQFLADTETYGEFRNMLHDEARQTEELLTRVAEQDRLLGADPVLRSSIQTRERMVLPLLVIQQWALAKTRRIRRGEETPGDQGLYERIIVKSLAASVNASRNAV
ncbi:MAG: phosphoenolpyruvate carboxylase [Spirochaetota bacterium]